MNMAVSDVFDVWAVLGYVAARFIKLDGIVLCKK